MKGTTAEGGVPPSTPHIESVFGRHLPASAAGLAELYMDMADKTAARAFSQREASVRANAAYMALCMDADAYRALAERIKAL